MKKTVFDETGLKEYQRKRDFRKTAEPPPRVTKSSQRPDKSKTSAKKNLFVIQKHDATRLHYDFRLEMEGVLKSWAVPKGPPMTRGDKRLAVQVEDHPFDYAKFEGTIPEGNYGAGTVMVWDFGTYTILAEDPVKALTEGKFHLLLDGKKLKGEWALVRMKPRPNEDKPAWLFFKSGEDAKPLSKKKEDESVLTGRSMAQIASQNKAQWKRNLIPAGRKAVDPRIVAAVEKRRRREATAKNQHVQKKRQTSGIVATTKGLAKLPNGKIEFIEPMKSRLVETAPKGPEWIYEIKFDGYRTLALKEGDTVELLSRNKKNFNHRFPEIARAIRSLPCRKAIIDGEVVALDEQGRSSFQLLQMVDMPATTRSALCFYAFDLLNLEGKSLISLPLMERKSLLQSLLRDEKDPIRFSANIHGDPEKLLALVRKMRLEGFIAKEATSKYKAGQRTGCWKKIRLLNEQEFVIGGYTQPKGSRDYFGSVVVGYYERGSRQSPALVFVSKVGSGFDQALLKKLHQNFKSLEQAACPFSNLPEKAGFGGRGLTANEMKRCTWVKPQLVCQIRFSEWTRDNHLRQPVFLGLREDKEAHEVVKEIPK